MDSQRKRIRVIFVIPSTCANLGNTSEEMQQAYNVCTQNEADVRWIHEQECKDLTLSKTDFMVFQTFEGDCFEAIKQTKCVRIVGPWCVLVCLTEGIEIPNYPWPIYTVAMRGCFITCTSLPKPLKKEIKEKIEYMGGCYVPDLVTNCTHLVTDSVVSEKYIRAREAGIKIMLCAWVNDVWNESIKVNIHCNNPLFDKHRCTIFHNLTVCCTGFNEIQRKDLCMAITENGGKYNEPLHVKATDILVCESISNSAKYKAARNHPKIKCVTIKWVEDSVKNGCTMPVESYSLKNILNSTPTKTGTICPNFSMISDISSIHLLNRNDAVETIEQTRLKSDITQSKDVSGLKRKSSSNEHNELVDAIDLKQIKTIGPFLHDCVIYLVGFGSAQREKLCKILNYSGATRYDQLSERVTHILVGDSSCNDVKVISSREDLKISFVVNIHWLLDSIKQKCAMDEDNYLLCNVINPSNEVASPLSKKGLQVLCETSKNKSSAKENYENLSLPPPEPEVDIIQRYLRPSASSQEDTLAKMLQNEAQFDVDKGTTLTIKTDSNQRLSAQSSSIHNRHAYSVMDVAQPNTSKLSRDGSISSAIDESSQFLQPIFEGLIFTVVGYGKDDCEKIVENIKAMEGKVVSMSYKGIIDYAIVPLYNSELRQIATEIVTDFWLFDCYENNEIKPVCYYHRPFSIDESAQPLIGCVVTLSNYTSFERQFLSALIIKLGGTLQEQFSRTNTEKTVASTHLICPEPNGKKYAAAVKWGIPVVTKDWLLECARVSSMVSLNPFSLFSRRSENAFSESTRFSKKIATPRLETGNFISNNEAVGSTINRESTLNANFSYNTNPAADALPINDNSPNVTHKSIGTPPFDNNFSISDRGKEVSTPQSRILRDVRNTSGVCSQITPVQSIIAHARKQNLLGTPETIPCPKPWGHVATPDTPLGAFIRPDPSPNLKKQMVKYLNVLPDCKTRRVSTPLTELKRRLWNKIYSSQDLGHIEQPNFESEEEIETTSNLNKNEVAPEIINNQLQQLQDMLTSTSSSRGSLKNKRQSIIPVSSSDVKDSQPNTVGWDDCMDCDAQQPQKMPVFILSGIEQSKRETIVTQLENLNGVVSNLSNFDPQATHLICTKLPRNEKVLACMAAGKWILHISYIEKCVSEGRLVDEEDFEFGNPKFLQNTKIQFDLDNESRLAAVNYWRKEIIRRGYGAFNDMRAIVVAQKRESIVRIIEAGGGTVVNLNPPYTQPVHATVCILDTKIITDFSDYIPLARQGIYCISVMYINEFLHRTASDIRNYIVPQLAPYYESA